MYVCITYKKHNNTKYMYVLQVYHYHIFPNRVLQKCKQCMTCVYDSTTTNTGFNPHHVKLSGLGVRPLRVSGGSPVHLRSKHKELVGKTLWVKQKKNY